MGYLFNEETHEWLKDAPNLYSYFTILYMKSYKLFTSILINLNQLFIEHCLQSQSLEQKYDGKTLKSNSEALCTLDAIYSYNTFWPQSICSSKPQCKMDRFSRSSKTLSASVHENAN